MEAIASTSAAPVRTAATGPCLDNAGYADHFGYTCADWVGFDCLDPAYGYDTEQRQSLALSVAGADTASHSLNPL